MIPYTVQHARLSGSSRAGASAILLVALLVILLTKLPAFSLETKSSDIADLEQAREAAKRGQYVECYNGICRVADHGHPQAQSILGQMYEDGIGVEKNIGKAIKYYEMAASKGIPEAENRLGHILYRGKETKRNPQQACKWLTKAARHNVPEAQNTLGHMYLTGDGVEKDLKAASLWLHKAANNGIKEAEQAIVDLPPVQPVTKDMGPGITFEQDMGEIEKGWQGYADVVQALRNAVGTN